jgi:hypothetical protein
MLADSAFLNMDLWEAIMPQRQFLACAFAILLSIGAAANAQDPKPFDDTVMPLEAIKYTLGKHLHFLSDRLKEPTPDLLGLHESSEQFNSLREAVVNALSSMEPIFNSKIKYSTQYLQMLKYDSQAFQAYATSIKEKTKIIQDVTNGVLTASADLLLKAKVLLTSNSDRVEVEVNTIDGGKNKVNGWSVFYTPYYHDDGAHLKRFVRMTPHPTRLWSGRRLYEASTHRR